jgi:hypothetical protein
MKDNIIFNDRGLKVLVRAVELKFQSQFFGRWRKLFFIPQKCKKMPKIYSFWHKKLHFSKLKRKIALEFCFLACQQSFEPSIIKIGGVLHDFYSFEFLWNVQKSEKFNQILKNQ